MSVVQFVRFACFFFHIHPCVCVCVCVCVCEREREKKKKEVCIQRDNFIVWEWGGEVGGWGAGSGGRGGEQ